MPRTIFSAASNGRGWRRREAAAARHCTLPSRDQLLLKDNALYEDRQNRRVRRESLVVPHHVLWLWLASFRSHFPTLVWIEPVQLEELYCKRGGQLQN